MLRVSASPRQSRTLQDVLDAIRMYLQSLSQMSPGHKLYRDVFDRLARAIQAHGLPIVALDGMEHLAKKPSPFAERISARGEAGTV